VLTDQNARIIFPNATGKKAVWEGVVLRVEDEQE
jgi:hypothetical protein